MQVPPICLEDKTSLVNVLQFLETQPWFWSKPQGAVGAAGWPLGKGDVSSALASADLLPSRKAVLGLSLRHGPRRARACLKFHVQFHGLHF